MGNIFFLRRFSYQTFARRLLSGGYLSAGILSSLILSAAAFASSASSVEAQAQTLQPPALVVLIAIDQMRRDRLDASMPGGLGRLLREGRVFIDSNLDHGMTNTCPGHVVMLTGVNPGRAGVVGNSYVNRETWSEAYCVDDSSGKALVLGSDHGRSPVNIKVSTLGDWMKSEQPATRVFSVSAKDRSAIALGGQKADGVFWFDREHAVYTSSHYYMNTLPAWLKAFNGSQPSVNGFFSEVPEVWEHPLNGLRPDDYSREDDQHLRTSGHPLKKGSVAETGQQFYNSPWSDTTVLDLAQKLVDEEQLGQRGVTDLLAISLSAVDTVGHLYGPFSSESADTLRNLDEKLGLWLKHIESSLGVGRVFLALTADHGVLELPEWKKENGKSNCPYEDLRGNLTSLYLGLMSRIYFNFTAPVDMPTKLIKFAGMQAYVNRTWAAQEGIDAEAVLDELEIYLQAKPYIKEVWNMEELYASKDSNQEVARLFRNSHSREQGGDLILQPYEDCLIRGDLGTTHLSPYDYDRNIPLIFWGDGVKSGRISGAAHSIDIAPTIANFLRIPVPENLDGKILNLHSEPVDANMIQTIN